MTVYVDVLILTNFYVDYLLLLATEKLCKIRTRFWRRVFSALFASLFSLSIFLPEMSMIETVAFRLVCVVLTVLIAYGFKSLRRTVNTILCFFAATYSFAGIMMAVHSLVNSQSIAINNSSVYINISPLLLVIMTTVCYLLISVYRRFISKSAVHAKYIALEAEYGTNSVMFDALLDTGNFLTDSVTDAPVIIISQNIAQKLLPSNFSRNDLKNVSEKWFNIKGFRLIPFSSIGSNGMLLAFKPDRLVIHDDKFYILKNVVLAVSPNNMKNNCEAIAGTEIIERKGEAECFSKI